MSLNKCVQYQAKKIQEEVTTHLRQTLVLATSADCLDHSGLEVCEDPHIGMTSMIHQTALLKFYDRFQEVNNLWNEKIVCWILTCPKPVFHLTHNDFDNSMHNLHFFIMGSFVQKVCGCTKTWVSIANLEKFTWFCAWDYQYSGCLLLVFPCTNHGLSCLGRWH